MALSFSGWRQHTTDAHGLRFSYLEWGTDTAPAVVLLHGATGTAHAWDQFAHLLQRDFRVFAPDQRGHGDTGWPDLPAYSTDDYVADLAALVDRWRLGRFALIGHSLGARNAIGFALAHPHRVERLVLVDTSPLSGSTEGPPWIALPTFGTFEEMLAASLQFNPRPGETWRRYELEHNARQLADGTWTRKHSPDLRRRHARDLWPHMARIACPTLVVRGEESTTLSADDARRLAGLIPQAELVTIAGASHTVAQDQPEAFARAVLPFLHGEAVDRFDEVRSHSP